MHSHSSLPCNPDMPTARTARLISMALWGFIGAGILAAPLLAAAENSFLPRLLYVFFSPVCHQLSSRSFSLAGFKWAVCQRCSGIYFGLFLSAFMPAAWFDRAARSQNRGLLIVAAGSPVALDVLLSFLGLWAGTGLMRFGTGLLAGSVINLIVLPAVVEFLFETRRTSFHARVPENQGDPL